MNANSSSSFETEGIDELRGNFNVSFGWLASRRVYDYELGYSIQFNNVSFANRFYAKITQTF